ncbi:hypothetical protein Salat_2638000 [Sesamum alatum]|uniref:Uncharacterized protein n=1 Tax=Sesamum alatum TaxID=300844 RepID=A0AAE2CAT8_9LAMI|nr:hypothetical protein Salat_2638000 [Sesamum alatum]
MARYESNGGHQAYGRTESGRGALTFFAYSASQSSATTEAVEFKVASDHHSPTRHELYKDQRVGHKPRPVLAHDHQQERGYDYSPKIGHVQTKGPPRENVYRDNNLLNSPKVDNLVVRGQTKGSPRDNVYRDNSPLNSPKVGNHVVRGQTKGSPWDNVYRGNSPSNSPKVDNHVVHGQTKGSPWDNVYRDNSPPSRDNNRTTHHYGKYNNDHVSSDDEDDDDVICKDGVCYKKVGTKQNHIKDDNHHKEKNKGYGYAPVSYSTMQPRKDTYYETSNINNPPHIRTRTSHESRWGPEFQNGSTRNSPVSLRTHERSFDASPREKDEGHREFVDWGLPRGGEHYTRKIDCKEAAKKYNGVLVST